MLTCGEILDNRRITIYNYNNNLENQIKKEDLKKLEKILDNF